jgi:hypothetical protein
VAGDAGGFVAEAGHVPDHCQGINSFEGNEEAMRLRIDAHIHLYPCYNLGTALNSLRANLAVGKETCCLAFLAERSDCHFFAEFRDRLLPLTGARLRVEQRENALLLREEGYPDLYIFPGRQINSRERVEILSLITDRPVPDGLPAQETVIRVRAAGGLPVVSWAPGKWLFARRKVVEGLLAVKGPGTLLVGDTSLRPRGLPMPQLMKRALAMGYGLVAGSDPLPFSGEERMLGGYGMEVTAPFDPADPAGSVRAILSAPGFLPRLVGRRGWPHTALLRLIRLARAKREAGRTART